MKKLENIGEVLLNDDQVNFISSLINMYGTGEHTVCTPSTFRFFKISYINQLLKLPEVEKNLQNNFLPLFESVKKALINPSSHYDVKVNSLWDYDRSLDNAKNTIGLKVKEIKDNLVFFFEEMPYKGYGIEYFNGKTFKPHIK